jgi:hypothetical protein
LELAAVELTVTVPVALVTPEAIVMGEAPIVQVGESVAPEGELVSVQELRVIDPV